MIFKGKRKYSSNVRRGKQGKFHQRDGRTGSFGLAHDKILRVARTIADLEQNEASGYRTLDRQMSV